jgi:hypothetical protein
MKRRHSQGLHHHKEHTMNTHRKILGMEIGLAMQVTWLWTLLLLMAGSGALVSAQPLSDRDEESSHFTLVRHEEGQEQVAPDKDDPRAMAEGEWEALAQKVAMNLNWIGIQMGVSPQELAFYVPALTQEYLQAFQLSLTQGATKQQADILASQYIFGRIRQLAAQSGSSLGSQGEEGCVYSRGGSFCAGSDGFRSFSFQ